MYKNDIINNVKNEVHVSEEVAGKVINQFLKDIQTEVANGGKVQLTGFGTFERVEKAQRTGRNPQTGAEMIIPATKAPKFKAGTAFKEAVK